MSEGHKVSHFVPQAQPSLPCVPDTTLLLCLRHNHLFVRERTLTLTKSFYYSRSLCSLSLSSSVPFSHSLSLLYPLLLVAPYSVPFSHSLSHALLSVAHSLSHALLLVATLSHSFQSLVSPPTLPPTPYSRSSFVTLRTSPSFQSGVPPSSFQSDPPAPFSRYSLHFVPDIVPFGHSLVTACPPHCMGPHCLRTIV